MAILYEYATPYSIINAGIDNIIKLMKKVSSGHYRIEDINRLMEIAEKSIVVRTLYYLDSYQVEYIEIDKYKLEYNEVI